MGIFRLILLVCQNRKVYDFDWDFLCQALKKVSIFALFRRYLETCRCPSSRCSDTDRKLQKLAYPQVHPSLFHSFVLQSIRPSVHPSFCSSVLISIRPSVHPSFCKSVLLFIRPNIYPSFSPSVLLYICPSVHPSFCTSVLLYIRPSVNPSSYLFILQYIFHFTSSPNNFVSISPFSYSFLFLKKVLKTF